MASGDATVAAPTVWAMRTDKVFIAFEVRFFLTRNNRFLGKFFPFCFSLISREPCQLASICFLHRNSRVIPHRSGS